jgi:chromosomal replication initiation ATPase DnaA
VCDQLRADLPPDDYVTWIAPLRLLDYGEDVAVIQTPNIFGREALDGRLHAPLVAACTTCFGPAISVQCVIAPPPTGPSAGPGSSGWWT